MKQALQTETYNPLLLLYASLQILGDPHIAQTEKSKTIHEITHVWEDFCKYYHLQDQQGRCTPENIRAALILGENELRESGIDFGEQEIEEVKKSVAFLLEGIEKKQKYGNHEEVFTISEDLEAYLQTGEGKNKYPVELLLQYINSETIGSIHEDILLGLIVSKKPGVSLSIVSCITPENISHLQGRNGRVLMKLIHGGFSSRIIHSIAENNIHQIDWSFFRKLKDNNDQESLDILLSRISEENSTKVHWSILDLLGYGGSWGEFLRTFSPDAQARFKSIEKKLNIIKIFLDKFIRKIYKKT